MPEITIAGEPAATKRKNDAAQKNAEKDSPKRAGQSAPKNAAGSVPKRTGKRGWWMLFAVLLLVLSTGDAAPTAKTAAGDAAPAVRAVTEDAEAAESMKPVEANEPTVDSNEPPDTAEKDSATETTEESVPKTAEEAIAAGIQKVTPTADELAALLDPDGESVPAAAEPSPESAAEPAPEPAVLAEPAREEKWLRFQGLNISITPEASWSSFQPGDFVWDGDRVRYTGDAYDAIFGIDVSRYHNEERPDRHLDWEAARKDGVEFAIIRAGGRGTTAGKLYEDAYFAMNAEEAHAAGIIVGAYIYSQAVSVEEALEEADFLLARLEGLTIDGPVCYDWEIPDRSSRAWFVTPETATACAAAFCDRIAAAGYTPMIYESKDVGYLKYDQAALEPYMLWYPQYPGWGQGNPYPDFLYHMDLWQFTDRCTVAGIGKRVDGSLWFRPRAES